jgi:hypothetical protein
MSGEVGLVGVKLAPLAGAYDIAGVRNRGRPVKALAESIANESTRRGVMAADPGVDVPQELAPLGDGHALSVFKPLDLHGRYPQQGRRWGSP